MSERPLTDPALDPRLGGRRAFLTTIATVGAGALAGCLGDDDGVPEPIAIADDHYCPMCNMVVVNHPGPAGHAFYPEEAEARAEQDGVVPYCASTCAYEHYFEKEEHGHEPIVLYLTDYSKVDWEVYEQGGQLFITAHFAAEDHTAATDLEFVVDSDVLGAMGESAIGFSDAADADAFAEEYGGGRYDHDSITRELIESLGFV
ncbi:nitrous oxide reductase accessory protein NosL [Natronobeatus ordinarius]|uniref:nitrous oxide reductase accessory protein NosL n=1 Tax=Natronobeatus ordinarius TaxID=2963433 RepID=UPI0020CFB837|nr:nitrous oxide reductase accessory protein NosL [Natronobeatus ordinarius]